MAVLKNIKLSTTYNEVHDITQDVKKVVEESDIQEGICIVHNMHSTAGLAVSSPWDPDGFVDLDEEIRRLVPTRIDFKHQHDTPQDAAGHIKCALLGVTETFIVHNGKLLLGGSQGIYFLEFDGPRNREFYVKVVEDK